MLGSMRVFGRRCGVALAFALTLGVGSPADARNPYPRKGDSDPHGGVAAARQHAVQGIDVSKYQFDIDWREVRKAGTRFAFIKATEGGDHLDSNFRDNWDGAREAGVPRGAYHFVFWCRPAKDQIRWFIRNVPKDPDALPPVLDVEWNHKSSCRKPSPEKARAKMREMLAAFHQHYGKKPMIYTDITFHEEVLEGTKEFDDYPFWIRSVAAKPQERYESRQWEFWQFTATGRVPGIKGDVDRNAFFGSEKQFRDWIEGRFDIGTRQMLKGEPKVAAAPVNPLPPAKPMAGPILPQAASETPLPRQRPLAFRPDDEDEPAIALPPRPRPIRVTPVRRDPNRLVPPGIVPDVTGAIRR
jgi:lysozyme